MKILSVAALAVLLAAGSATADAAPRVRASAVQADSAHTPARGSAERAAIMDALRAHRRRFDARPVIFVVNHLRVQRGWAWAAVAPQSPDGRSRYEEESALLRLRAGRWQVVELMPAFGEREGTPDEEDCAWFQHLRRRLPAVPAAILPAEGRRPCLAPHHGH
ncbi:hypothetical protein [Longimicrobium sp.]|uniref:hypothetical protein n=1 Tax=Longimicrobium sp. TaxID=2029185 RepID=UPI002CF1731F|nr:hypothetical protein [Longimicrobium sp.]HSU16294.1 hypothetical protein [Longimicrobium sp.]